MDRTDTQAFSDATVEVQMAEWSSASSIDGFYFTVITGANFGGVFLLDKADTVVGRSDDADIQIDDEKVSRRHLKISLVQSDGQENGPIHALVSDLNSTNGIFINGARVRKQELRNGDKLRIGNTILKFEVKDCLDVSYHDKLYQQATKDPLTGLSNRNYLQNELSKFIAIGLRYNRVFSMLLLDIDFFKVVNDTYGHTVGDNVLTMVAEILLSNKREQDVTARFGGEEFVVLLPETTLDSAMDMAERIRMTFENFDFTPLGCQHTVTTSIGISEFPLHGMKAEELVKCADEALYEAKTSGRNRVCTARALTAS